MNSAPRPALRLLGTHWETPNLSRANWVESPFELDPSKTGFVALHLWSVGDVNGPKIPDRYLVDMGLPQTQAESLRICQRYIRPAIDASRAAGIPVFHVEPRNIAKRYPSHRYLLDEDELHPPSAVPQGMLEANPGWKKERAERTHGSGYREWEGWEQMHIAASCEPEEQDQVIVTAKQFDRICQDRGIKNLIYTGFATNMCIMHSAAATIEMLGYGYKIFLIREATLAVEYPESWKERLVTKTAIKEFQLTIGDSIGFDQYMAACAAVSPGKH